MIDGPDTLVVGLGTRDRGDDAAGPAVAGQVAAAVRRSGSGHVRVTEHADPTALIDLLGTSDPHRPAVSTVIVVDAVRSTATPGTVLVFDVGPGAPDQAVLAGDVDPGPAGTHGFGLAGAIELARALDRLPARVLIVGVVAQHFEHGVAMSEAVVSALPQATSTVLDLLGAGSGAPKRTVDFHVAEFSGERVDFRDAPLDRIDGAWKGF